MLRNGIAPAHHQPTPARRRQSQTFPPLQPTITRPGRVGDSDAHPAPSTAAVPAATASPTVSCDPKANRPHSAPVVGLWEGKLAPPECVSRPAIQCPYDI